MAIRRILLPLDGSELSETAIPLAESLARAQGAEVILARVVPPFLWYDQGQEGYMDPQVYDDMVRLVREEADTYLAGKADLLRSDGLTVTVERLDGTPAATLLDCEERLRPDLVVMATHGRTGLARFALGSTADIMVREGGVPVLFARSFSLAFTKLETALVPLDGSDVAEQALPMVEALAGKPLRAVRLLQAIASTDEYDEATAYLQRVAERLSPLDIAVSVEVEIEAPVDAISRAAEGVDLVVLSTHGRGGLERLRHGSVAEQAMRHLATPTLLVRATA
jgi:nucleotide-binding universal stress UspA family protein